MSRSHSLAPKYLIRRYSILNTSVGYEKYQFITPYAHMLHDVSFHVK